MIKKNTISLRDTRNNSTHMVFEGELAVKLHAHDVAVRTITNGSPKTSQSYFGEGALSWIC